MQYQQFSFITLRLYQRNVYQVLEGRQRQLSNKWGYFLWLIFLHFCSSSRSSTVSRSQETKTADVRFVLLTELVIKYLRLCIFAPLILYKKCYFAFTFQHLADAFTTVERQRKEEYNLNSKAVQFIATIFQRVPKLNFKKRNISQWMQLYGRKVLEFRLVFPVSTKFKMP